ncbi:hypothetical protein R3P38DRAFT_3190799 [Favolaschia claudopus]|uniref:Homeobox domain-containing protein n=1 Tax=Favolaschia claudopus TaxID=2862362 RepID=A0AAW0BMF8_9AGAR
MAKGRKSPLPADKTEYLESHLPEYFALKPNFGGFWKKVERGWFEKFPVEPSLGLPLRLPGVAIEDSGLPPEQVTAIGIAEIRDMKVIYNWFKNRAQKEKKLLNAGTPASTGSGAFAEIMTALGAGTRPRRKQRREIWERRNADLIKKALAEAGYNELMGRGSSEETAEERKARIAQGRSDLQILRRRIVAQLMAEASEEEMKIVNELYSQQPKPSKADPAPVANTPEGLQQGIERAGPLLKNVHDYLEHTTGLVGVSMLVGPIPNQGGKIGTQTYCHGVTSGGHTFDQAHSGWEESVVKPLHQFGKKVFDHQTRRERAIRTQASSEPDDTRTANSGESSGDVGGSPRVNTPPPAAPIAPTSESQGDTHLETPLVTSTAPEITSAGSEPPPNLSPPRTTLFLPGEGDEFGQQDYPPLDLGLDFTPLSDDILSRLDAFSTPPEDFPGPSVFSFDPAAKSPITDDTPSVDRPGNVNSSSTTTPAPVRTPAPTDVHSAGPASSVLTQTWVFPSQSTPSATSRLTPCTPTSFHHPRVAPASDVCADASFHPCGSVIERAGYFSGPFADPRNADSTSTAKASLSVRGNHSNASCSLKPTDVLPCRSPKDCWKCRTAAWCVLREVSPFFALPCIWAKPGRRKNPIPLTIRLVLMMVVWLPYVHLPVLSSLLLGHTSVLIPLRPPPCLYVPSQPVPHTHSSAESTYLIATLSTLSIRSRPTLPVDPVRLPHYWARFPFIPLSTSPYCSHVGASLRTSSPYDMDNSTSLSSTVRPRNVANASLEVYSRRLWHLASSRAPSGDGRGQGERPDEVPAGRMRMENGERGDLQAGVG